MKVAKYENLHIGNFLISVGYYLRELAGALPSTLPTSINLTQQSGKADYTVGDLFGFLGGKCFILEFKKDQKSIAGEMLKPQRKALIDELRKNDPLKQISVISHLICYPTYEAKSMNYNLGPYCFEFGLNVQEPYDIKGVDNFIKKLMVNKVGATFSQIAQYFDLLRKCAGTPTFKSSGTLFSYNSKSGFVYVEYEDLNVLNYKIEVDLEIQKKVIQQQNIDLNQGKKNDQGMKFNM